MHQFYIFRFPYPNDAKKQVPKARSNVAYGRVTTPAEKTFTKRQENKDKIPDDFALYLMNEKEEMVLNKIEQKVAFNIKRLFQSLQNVKNR